MSPEIERATRRSLAVTLCHERQLFIRSRAIRYCKKSSAASEAKTTPPRICNQKSNGSSLIMEECRCNGNEGLTSISPDGMHSKSVVDCGSPLACAIISDVQAQRKKVVNKVRFGIGEEIVQVQSSTEEGHSNEVAVDQENAGQISKASCTLATTDTLAPSQTADNHTVKVEWLLGELVLNLTGFAINQFSNMHLGEYEALDL